LHSHTIFSTLDGIAKPEEYFAECSNRKWSAMAITEHGVLSSIPDAFWASKEYDIKYIPGCEVYYNDYEPKRREMAEAGTKIGEIMESNPNLGTRIRRNRHLTVLCKNETGYHNLLAINRHAWEHGFYYKPRTWFDQLVKHKEGLIILSGCLNGPLSNELRLKNYGGGEFTGAMEYFKMFNDVFGDDYYIEVQMPCIEFSNDSDGESFHDSVVFNRLVQIADGMNKKLVLTNDSHYMKREDFQIQKLMMAVDQGTTVDDPNLFHVNSDDQFFKTRAELRETFINNKYSDKVGIETFEKACDNTLEIAEKCNNFDFDLSPKLPIIDDADNRLQESAARGLIRKGLYKDKTTYHVDGREVTALEQMQIEVERINEKGYSSYFMITKELVDHARSEYGQNGVGPGRGSAGGSLVCYLLGITGINPLKWKLSFDRMLSPARGGMMLKVQMDE